MVVGGTEGGGIERVTRSRSHTPAPPPPDAANGHAEKETNGRVGGFSRLKGAGKTEAPARANGECWFEPLDVPQTLSSLVCGKAIHV